MNRRQRWNTHQIYTRRDSNSGCIDLWSYALPTRPRRRPVRERERATGVCVCVHICVYEPILEYMERCETAKNEHGLLCCVNFPLCSKGYSALSPLSGQLLHAPGRRPSILSFNEKETQRRDIYLEWRQFFSLVLSLWRPSREQGAVRVRWLNISAISLAPLLMATLYSGLGKLLFFWWSITCHISNFSGSVSSREWKSAAQSRRCDA
jgi:hypothetical protein